MNWLNSIRGRLALVSAAVIALALTIAGFGLFLLFESYIERRVGQELRGRILDVAGGFTLDETGKAAMTRAPSDPRYRNPYGGAYWYAREDNQLLLQSRSLWDSEIIRPVQMSALEQVVTAPGPEGDVYLMEKSIVLGEGADQRTFVIGAAIDQADVKALSSALGTETAIALGLLGVILFAGAWLQASYGLQPLQAMRRQLAQLHSGQRDRLDGPFPEEVEGLTRDLNALFGQQKDMIARARERAGTLAHGLKTPMTILYGETRRLERNGEAQSAAFMRQQLDQIQQQVERELSRARAHGATAGIGLHANVTATAQRIIGLMQRMPHGSDINWHVPDTQAHAIMDADDCGEVLGNLLDNARKWAKSKVIIDVQAADDGKIRISVSDDGPGLPEGWLVARGSSTDGGGLGLAIVADLIAPYGGRLALGESTLGGASVSFDIAGTMQADQGEDP